MSAEKDENRKGLVDMEIAEGVKLQLCYVLHHLLDLQKRHRVESLIAFAHDYVGEVSGLDWVGSLEMLQTY